MGLSSDGKGSRTSAVWGKVIQRQLYRDATEHEWCGALDHGQAASAGGVDLRSVPSGSRSGGADSQGARLSITVGPRWEGVPARIWLEATMGSAAWIRGVDRDGIPVCAWRSLFTGTVGKAILRDRTRSYPDRVYGAHGDAAFADYVWLASYSVRFGGVGARLIRTCRIRARCRERTAPGTELATSYTLNSVCGNASVVVPTGPCEE